MSDTHDLAILSSLLEHDIKVSTMYRLRYYARMPQEDKERLQERHIESVIHDIISAAQSGQRNGSLSVRTEPKEIYPLEKMLKDIKTELMVHHIKVTKVLYFKRRNN